MAGDRRAGEAPDVRWGAASEARESGLTGRRRDGGALVNVLKVYFTPTRIEADEVVFVTGDHNLADYAAYPVNSVDADRRVFRTDNRFQATSLIVMTGSSSNPYADYAGGKYNLGASAFDSSPDRASRTRSAPYKADGVAHGGFDNLAQILGTLIRVAGVAVAIVAAGLGMYRGIGAAVLPGITAFGMFLFGALLISPSSFIGSKLVATVVKDIGSFLLMAGYIAAPILAIVALIGGHGEAALMWFVVAVVMFILVSR
jgi:hypothetical protein